MAERGRPRGFDRDAALRSAMEMFWAHGYEGTSIADLTELIGVKAASLYAAFGSKEALFREAVDLYSSTVGGVMVDCLLAESRARDAVEQMLRRRAESLIRAQTPGCMVVMSAMTTSDKNDSVRVFLAEARKQLEVGILARLERDRADGDFPATTDTAALAAYYMTVLSGMAVQARDGASLPALYTIVDCAMAAWEPLITPAPLDN